jgi:hypothetical protein
LPGIAGWRNDLSRRKREHISIRNSRFRIGLSSTVHSVRIAHFREDFTTDFTDCTDGKEKKKVGKLQLFIREIREIRGNTPALTPNLLEILCIEPRKTLTLMAFMLDLCPGRRMFAGGQAGKWNGFEEKEI